MFLVLNKADLQNGAQALLEKDKKSKAKTGKLSATEKQLLNDMLDALHLHKGSTVRLTLEEALLVKRGL